MDTRHTQTVTAIAAQVQAFYTHRKPFKVYHGSTNSTRVITFDRDAMVDVSGLERVLNVDTARMVAVAEANVPMDKLVQATLPHGLVPRVVMEFPGITVGGGLQGGAGESSSFKWGTFNRTLNWYEIVLGDGNTVTASPKNCADLFWGAAGSYGSLGVVTAAEVQLMPAKQYVNLTYTPVHSFTEAVELTTKATRQSYDYVDGILFSAGQGVIITGRLSDQPTRPIRTFSRPRDPWYYLHVQKLAGRSGLTTEAVPLQDYLFRYDRGAFWMGSHAFTRLKTPFNAVTRRLLDPVMHTRRLYEGLQASGISQECIIQDIAVPAEHTPGFLDYIDKTFAMYPLWLCPLLPDSSAPLLSNALKTKLVINVGVWSLYRKPYEEFVRANRALEQAVAAHKGKKWLYAQIFYTEKEFWNLYDKKHYDALRTKYRAITLPNVYQKISGKRIKVSTRRGVVRGLLGLKGVRISAGNKKAP